MVAIVFSVVVISYASYSKKFKSVLEIELNNIKTDEENFMKKNING